MKNIMIAACALALSTSFAAAQSSQGKGGAAVTNESADQMKTPGSVSQDNKGAGAMGTTGSSMSKTGGANKNGDGQMSKGGMSK